MEALPIEIELLRIQRMLHDKMQQKAASYITFSG